MKITRKQLKNLIAESIREHQSILLEFPGGGGPVARMGPHANDADKDPAEEGSVARKSLFHLGAQANQLHAMLADDENLEPWVQEKIAVAAENLENVFKHITYDKQNPLGR
jgi:hypothetical protein|tara:strand:- start:94 stop:426 length:333 start_codon:yes stop_codon:yes gene_type:complete